MIKNYILMNRSDEAAILTLNTSSEDHIIERIEILDRSKLPFPARYSHEADRIASLEEWIFRRLLARSRYGLKKILTVTGQNRLESSLQAYGLTLTDGFWFKPEDEPNLKWEQINFFTNSFSSDIGNLAFNLPLSDHDLLTPDLTTNGRMEKAWKRSGSTTWLLKKGSPPYFEEPFNEKIVSQIMKKVLKIPFVDYDVIFVNHYAASICQNFTRDGIEFVSAADLVRTERKPSFLDMDTHLRERCKFFSIPGYVEFLNQLKIIDYITGNKDRHMGNYGFLYDSDTEKFIGPAPVYDNGSSLWFDTDVEEFDKLMDDAGQSAKQLSKEIRKPENYLLSPSFTQDLQSIVTDTYASAGLYSERASHIEKVLTQRYQCLSESLERAAEKRMERDDVLIKYAKQHLSSHNFSQEVI